MIMAVKKKSAGILVYRVKNKQLEVLLVHPGGPFWKNKDEGAWSIPKGEADEDEDLLATAIREFEEETGTTLQGDFIELTPIRLKSGKWVYAWALKENIDEKTVQSNLFEMEWPPRSGKKQSFPEIDKAGWFTVKEASKKINTAQAELLYELERLAIID
jgi:predicted NUDIX family NTP pyrophosphohydrolase